MNFTVPEILKFFAVFRKEIKAPPEVEIVFAPAFTALYPVVATLAETSYKVAAQNMHWEDSGAFTGEVSGSFLKDLGVGYVILGHSERREHFGETDLMINKKMGAAVRHDLSPILCVGERERQRNEGETFGILESQIKKALEDRKPRELESLVIAYEPVWAIGSGKSPLPDEIQEIHKWIRELVSRIIDAPTAETLRIIYGGSVSPEKVRGILVQGDVDGLLVGGASLEPESFAEIVRSTL